MQFVFPTKFFYKYCFQFSLERTNRPLKIWKQNLWKIMWGRQFASWGTCTNALKEYSADLCRRARTSDECSNIQNMPNNLQYSSKTRQYEFLAEKEISRLQCALQLIVRASLACETYVITFEFKFTLFGTVIDRLACSKSSDSGELLFFHAPFYFAPLPTIWKRL